MDAGDSRLFHMTRREVAFPHFGPRRDSRVKCLAKSIDQEQDK